MRYKIVCETCGKVVRPEQEISDASAGLLVHRLEINLLMGIEDLVLKDGLFTKIDICEDCYKLEFSAQKDFEQEKRFALSANRAKSLELAEEAGTPEAKKFIREVTAAILNNECSQDTSKN